jgi:hypothetical protein
MSAEEAMKELEKLREKNAELRGEKQRLKQKVEAIPDGVDVAELLRFKQETELKQLEGKGDYDKARQQLQEQYDRDIKQRDARIAELEAKVRDLELITPAASVLAQVVHEPQDVFATGRLKAEMIEQGDNGPVVVEGLARVPLAEWAKQKLPAYMLKAPKPQGTGAPAGGSGGAPSDLVSGLKNPFSREHYNLSEQQRIFLSDPSLYQQLKAAAQSSMARA